MNVGTNELPLGIIFVEISYVRLSKVTVHLQVNLIVLK
jgi:hypothetical protein